jgi:hypothetical protein
MNFAFGIIDIAISFATEKVAIPGPIIYNTLDWLSHSD